MPSRRGNVQQREVLQEQYALSPCALHTRFLLYGRTLSGEELGLDGVHYSCQVSIRISLYDLQRVVWYLHSDHLLQALLRGNFGTSGCETLQGSPIVFW